MSARRYARNWVLAPLAIVVAATSVAATAAGADPIPGSQGTDTSLPATDSQVTVKGRGRFADLTITVNQTENLTNQAVSIDWDGGTQTTQGPGRFGAHYLQIMQCWGDPDGTVAENPGPPPEQCVQGAVGGTHGGLPGGLYPPGFALSRVISRSTWDNYDPAVGVLDTRTTNVWRPFRAVDGTVVDIQTDPTFNPSAGGGNFWLNPYFGIVTTNEIVSAASGPDGSGAELMQVLTGVQSSGLGCGQTVQPDDSGRKMPQCWIVIVPRGAPAEENVGTPFEVNADQNGVVTSPVAPAAWGNRIAIPIEFNPVDSPCSIADEERRIAGNELALAAVASWQPSLCASGDLPPYSYASVGDLNARQQLTRGAQGAPGLVAISRPIPPESAPASNPVVYAPLSLSGLVIGFNVERYPKPSAPEAAQRLAGVRVADLNLTPRLVAKLLTQSYSQQLSIIQPPRYEWLRSNPPHLGQDPDFLRFNPEFELLQIANARTFSGLQLPAGNSDAALQVWEWVLADPEARAWLDGTADEWGMRVNPLYATSAEANPTGLAFGDPVPSSFPKGDPYCYQAPPRGSGNSIVPPALCGTDWMPYARGFADAALITRVASDGARIVENSFAQSASEVWARELPQFLGRRAILSLTDTPSAAQFGLQTARLSRAGDNRGDRVFIAPDAAGLIAGVKSMEAGDEPSVLEPSPTSIPPDAYPLTALTYAAIAPLALDAAARSDYAAFIEYAADQGQEPGLEPGKLPIGYTPLPFALRIEALFAAFVVRALEPAAPEPVAPPVAGAPAAEAVVTTPATTQAPATAPTSTAPIEQPVPAAPSTGPPASGAPRSTSSAGAAPATDEPAAEQTPILDQEAAPADEAPPGDEDVDTTPSRSSALTPIMAIGRSRYAVPGLGVVALGSLLGALEISKRPRRRLADDTSSVDEPVAVGES